MEVIKEDKLKVAVCELTSSNDLQKNMQMVYDFLETIPNGVDIISLPENTFYTRLSEGDRVEYLKVDNPFIEKFKDLASERNVLIHIGASPLELEGQYYNATVLIHSNGRVEVPYKKIHLFDIQLENQKPIRESDIFKHGTEPTILNFMGWRLGFAICYDIRFSELFLYYQQQETDVIFIPSAFLVETGRAHWEILNRARAIESQCFVVSAAQGGEHSPTRKTYGHSIAVDPWGNVLTRSVSETRPSYQLVELDKALIQKVRKQIPMKDHRRISLSFNV